MPALSLLSEAELEDARLLGRAVRLGAMISGSAPGVLPLTRLRLDAETLTLRLRRDVASLAGEIVSKRLAAVAECVGRESGVELVDAQDD